jgi:hypothetical protein
MILNARYSTLELEKKVSKAIDEGWVPCGGVSVTSQENGDPCNFHQAMVRPAKGGAAT